MKPRIVALVPMRHRSERVAGKNYRPFGGLALFHHILNSLMACGRVDRIVVDTDSPVVIRQLRESFPEVLLLKRPNHLRDDRVPMNAVLAWDISRIAADVYLQTHSTNPLLRPETIRRAIEYFLSRQPHFDSLFSVTRLQARLWDQQGRAVNHDPAVLLRTQDLPPLFEENSNLYIFTRASFERAGSRIGEHPLMFEIDRLEALDIDEETDFQLAESIYHQFVRKSPEKNGNREKGFSDGALHAAGHQSIPAAV